MHGIRWFYDVLIEKRVIGRILGKGGRDLEALQLCTGSEGYIIHSAADGADGAPASLHALHSLALPPRL